MGDAMFILGGALCIAGQAWIAHRRLCAIHRGGVALLARGAAFRSVCGG